MLFSYPIGVALAWSTRPGGLEDRNGRCQLTPNRRQLPTAPNRAAQDPGARNHVARSVVRPPGPACWRPREPRSPRAATPRPTSPTSWPRPGASVGSLYHHFTGKADLFLTLFEEFHTRLAERTRTAVRQQRELGVNDPKQLFLAGARAYLDGCIGERDLSALFTRGDGPPGFELILRQRQREWAEKNAEFFARGSEPADDAVAVVLTGALMLAVAEVSFGGDIAAARSLADRVISVIGRIDITGGAEAVA